MNIVNGGIHQRFAGCRELARRHNIPWIHFQGRTGLKNRDFSDLWHTIRSGQIKWQKELAPTTARLLDRYGIVTGLDPLPTPTPSPSDSSIGPAEPAF